MALALACALCGLALFVFLLKRGDWMREAAWRGDNRTAKLLVWLGTDVNHANGAGTALHGAVATGNADLAEFLLEHGANVNFAAKWGITPYWQTRGNPQSPVARVLLAHGANPDTGNVNPP